MKKYAVAYISFFDNDLTIEFVDANSVREAANVFLKYENVEELPEDLEELRKHCFNMDCMVDVRELG